MNMTSIRINTKLCAYHYSDTHLDVFESSLYQLSYLFYTQISCFSFPAINTSIIMTIERIRPLSTELCYEGCLPTFPIVFKNITKE